MQTIRQSSKLTLFILVLIGGCNSRQSFEDAIAKYRGSEVDHVGKVLEGVPFFSTKTLNPVWEVGDKSRVVKIPTLALIDQDGKQRDENMFRDRISIVGFMFASCQGFCPFLIEGMKAIDQELRSMPLEKVQFVALSVNPEQDTPEKLKEYANGHNLDTKARWTFLTGQKATIYDLAKETFVSQVFKRNTTETNFVHSEHLYVIDGEGYLRGILNGTRVDVKRDAKVLVAKISERPNLAAP